MKNLADYPEILTTKDMCGYFRCSPATLRKRVRGAELPEPWFKSGRDHLWTRWSIEQHLGIRIEQPAPEDIVEDNPDHVEIAGEATAYVRAFLHDLMTQGGPRGYRS